MYTTGYGRHTGVPTVLGRHTGVPTVVGRHAGCTPGCIGRHAGCVHQGIQGEREACCAESLPFSQKEGLLVSYCLSLGYIPRVLTILDIPD